MGEIEYIAGFFDGEGSVGIYANGRGLFHLRTQLTQNVGKHSTRLADMLVSRFGGHYSMNLTLSGYTNFNWQLSSTPALRFMEQIEPKLLLKKEQVRIAIGWQRQRPLPSRDERGRMKKYAVDHAFDERVSLLVKALKKTDLDHLIAEDPSLWDLLRKLRVQPSIPDGFFLQERAAGYNSARNAPAISMRHREPMWLRWT